MAVPCNLQQNGVAERKNRTIVGAARSMIHDQGLPLFLWAEACNTAVYLQNRSPYKAVGNMTPEEAFTGKRPHVDHLRMFGCVTFSHVPKEKRTKMEPTTEKGIFVGYSETSKAYRLYIPGYRTVVVRRDVKFEEDRAFRKSRFSDEVESETQQQQQQQGGQVQSSGSQGSGSGGTGVSTITGSPAVSSGIGSQGRPQVSSTSSTQMSPLMDSSHGTSADSQTGTGAGLPGSRRTSSVGSSEDEQEVVSGGRRPRWLQETLRDTVGAPRIATRESRPPERFCSYVALAARILDSKPSSYEEAAG